MATMALVVVAWPLAGFEPLRFRTTALGILVQREPVDYLESVHGISTLGSDT